MQDAIGEAITRVRDECNSALTWCDRCHLPVRDARDHGVGACKIQKWGQA